MVASNRTAFCASHVIVNTLNVHNGILSSAMLKTRRYNSDQRWKKSRYRPTPPKSRRNTMKITTALCSGADAVICFVSCHFHLPLAHIFRGVCAEKTAPHCLPIYVRSVRRLRSIHTFPFVILFTDSSHTSCTLFKVSCCMIIRRIPLPATAIRQKYLPFCLCKLERINSLAIEGP